MPESDDGLIWRKRSLFQEERGDETAFLFEPNPKTMTSICMADLEIGRW